VENWLASRGALFAGRAEAAFHPQARVISQVTCTGRSRNAGVVPMPLVRKTGARPALAWFDFEVPADNCEAVGMPHILGPAMSSISAESHTNP